MGPCPITTTLYALEPLKLLADVSVVLSSITLTRTTNLKEAITHILLFPGSCVSGIQVSLIVSPSQSLFIFFSSLSCLPFIDVFMRSTSF